MRKTEATVAMDKNFIDLLVKEPDKIKDELLELRLRREQKLLKGIAIFTAILFIVSATVWVLI